MDGRAERRKPAASLSDELIVDILSRLPVRSLCRFKCVSRTWRRLISHPTHRKKMPHTLAGFLYQSYDCERSPRWAHHFTNVSGKGIPFVYPSFSFLPVPSNDVDPFDCCNGLLLCSCSLPGPRDRDYNWPFCYVVCNPATEMWVMLPPGGSGSLYNTARLCFDPAVSSHFSVIEFVSDPKFVGDDVVGLEIYSSRTGTWSSKPGWTDELAVCRDRRSVFLNGFLNSVTFSNEILAIDMEGEAWRTIPMPSCRETETSFLHQAQGHLCIFNVDEYDPYKLTVHILQDDKWVLKHRVSTELLFGWKGLRSDIDYKVIAVHPECNLVFFVYGRDNTLMAYEMDRREVRVIRNLRYSSRLSSVCPPFLRINSRWGVKQFHAECS
ncbi:hypothetical protein ACP4OV_001584 [Aristida adscensionis]